MTKLLVTIFIAFTLTTSCNLNDKTRIAEPEKTDKNQVYRNDSLTSILNSNKQFFKDSLLIDTLGVIDNYFSKYHSDTCGIFVHKNSELKEEFKGIRIVQGIKANKQKDSVFVVPNFNYCDDGESYFFYDKTLPRLYIDSYCCHPDNFFVCADIDEDGINEVGIYYSSCSSRYKSLRIYSLKQNSWKKIGTSTFDVMTKDPTKIKFADLVKKISKDKFSICNFGDGQTRWETIVMK